MNKLYYCVMVSLLVVPEPATFVMCGLLALALIEQVYRTAVLAVTSTGTPHAGQMAGNRSFAAVPASAGDAGFGQPVFPTVKPALPDQMESGVPLDWRTAGRIRERDTVRIPFAENPVVG